MGLLFDYCSVVAESIFLASQKRVICMRRRKQKGFKLEYEKIWKRKGEKIL